MRRVWPRFMLPLGILGSVLCGSAPSRAATAPADDSAHVEAAAPRDYLAEARAAFTPENRDYQRIRIALALVSPLVSVALGLLLLATGLAQRFRDLANARARGRWARMLIFFTLYSLVGTLVLLPLEFYSSWVVEHQFGLSNQSLGSWALDQLKGLGFEIVAVGVVPILALAWLAIESSPRRWWLWLSLGSLPVLVAAVLLQPLVFDPLFNKFTPLHDAALRRDILALGARAHIPAHDVYEVDASQRTKKVNAYV